MSEHVVELTERSFEASVLKSDKPVLVDFWAVWCGPCRQVAPIVESLAVRWGNKAVVGKVNVDEHPAIAEKYNIMSIPTLALFKNGEVVERVIGSASENELERKFGPHVA